ncbi:MAG: hypothetical protein JO191_02500, partial [Mycobacteriaceae bacterium]|nr:hypothetical protein [Mycobacteriaceae bacterium]
PEATEPAPDRIPEPTPEHVPEPGPAEVPEPNPVEVPERPPEQTAEQMEPADRPVIEEEFPATQMPVIAGLEDMEEEVETASNGISGQEQHADTSARLEPVAPSDNQPNSVEPQ